MLSSDLIPSFYPLVREMTLITFYGSLVAEGQRFDRLMSDWGAIPALQTLDTDKKTQYFYERDALFKQLIDAKQIALNKLQSPINQRLRNLIYYPLVSVTVATYLFSIYFGSRLLSKTQVDADMLHTLRRWFMLETGSALVLQMIGLVAGLLGSIMLALSLVSSETVGTHTDDKGKTTDFMLPNFKKCRFRCGLLLLSCSFLLQIIAILYG